MCCLLSDEESDTATEGEEEIRARELRKQEVRVEPPIAYTDTGTSTEVNAISKDIDNSERANDPSLPDILPSAEHREAAPVASLNKSSDNINTTDFDSAESEPEIAQNTIKKSPSGYIRSKNLDISEVNVDDYDSGYVNEYKSSNIVVGKLKDRANIFLQTNHNPGGNVLSRSATVGSIKQQTPKPAPVKRNFVIPKKEEGYVNPNLVRKELESVLVIKRTPNKVALPKEVGVPKVAVGSNLDTARKYFGESKPKFTPRSPMKRSDTLKSNISSYFGTNSNNGKTTTQNRLIKQSSLPETNDEKQAQPEPTNKFNFEVEDNDLNNIDDYIENLLKNEDELMKPVQLPQPEVSSSSEDENDDDDEEKASSSIEDLLKALKNETEMEIVDEPVKDDEKIEDLLSWMDELDYSIVDHKVSRSLSDAKYKNLERGLKRSDTVINKLPKTGLKLFEDYLHGKIVRASNDEDDEENFALSRSKTDVYCNKPRQSVDLDAVKKVDVKRVLQKFESVDTEKPPVMREKKPIQFTKMFDKRKSLGNFTGNELNNNNETVKPVDEDLEQLRHDLKKSKSVLMNIKKFESNQTPDSQHKTNRGIINAELKQLNKKFSPLIGSNKDDDESSGSNDSLENALKDFETFHESYKKPDLAKKNDERKAEFFKCNVLIKQTSFIDENQNKIDPEDHESTNLSKADEEKSKINDQIKQNVELAYNNKNLQFEVDMQNALQNNKEEGKESMKSVEDKSERIEEEENEESSGSEESDTSESTTGESDDEDDDESEDDEEKVELKSAPENIVPKTTDTKSVEAKNANDEVAKKLEEIEKSHDIVGNTINSPNDNVNANVKVVEMPLTQTIDNILSNIDANMAKMAVSSDANKVVLEDKKLAEPMPIYSVVQKPKSIEETQAAQSNGTKPIEIVHTDGALNVDAGSPPIVPQRTRKNSQSGPPQRPQRQKSFERQNQELRLPEYKHNVIRSAENSPILGRKDLPEGRPIPPMRKKSLGASPLPLRKNLDLPTDILRNKAKSDLNLNEPKKEVANMYMLPKPERIAVPLHSASSHSCDNINKNCKSQEKECCIQ